MKNEKSRKYQRSSYFSTCVLRQHWITGEHAIAFTRSLLKAAHKQTSVDEYQSRVIKKTSIYLPDPLLKEIRRGNKTRETWLFFWANGTFCMFLPHSSSVTQPKSLYIRFLQVVTASPFLGFCAQQRCWLLICTCAKCSQLQLKPKELRSER